MIYNYAFMHEKANELRACIPGLIEAEKWDEIRDIARINPSFWDGPAADCYDGDVLSACGRQDARLALELPNLIELALQRMSCSDEMVAQMIEQSFAAFY